MKKISMVLLALVCFMTACTSNPHESSQPEYKFNRAVEVDGRQGVAAENGYCWVSGSTTLSKYDANWNLIAKNDSPLDALEIPVNHIGDIDVHDNEIYVGAEYFMDGVGKDIQIAIYDGDTLELKRSFGFEPASGQEECSGIAVDPDTDTVVMVSWVGEESGRYIYRYDLHSGAYLGKVHLQAPPQWLQGIAYHDGYYYMTADDGTADLGEADHIYRTKIVEGQSWCTTEQVLTLTDVTLQGEIEGLNFDETKNQLLVLYNRGSRIVQGMVMGFYDGYDREISEVLIYDYE